MKVLTNLQGMQEEYSKLHWQTGFQELSIMITSTEFHPASLIKPPDFVGFFGTMYE